MSAPGWYPDPRGGGGRRYWDGHHWTNQVQGPGQYPQQPTPGGSTVALWITLAVSLALIIGLGAWLLFFRDTAPQTSPSPSPTLTEPEAATAEPEPDPTAATAEPVSTVVEGDELSPMQCAGTAADGKGEADAQGRFESAAGLSFPGVDGFTAQTIQYPWVWGSNSQFKDYGNEWIASLTVGTLEADDGFREHEQAAVRLAQCMLSSQFYGDHFVRATVFAIDSQTENSVTWLDVDVDVAGVDGVSRDWVTIVTAEHDDELHVGITVVPDSSDEDYESVQEAFSDLRFS